MLPPSVLPPFAPSYPSFHLNQPVLKVLGLGGGGCNAVERMFELGPRLLATARDIAQEVEKAGNIK